MTGRFALALLVVGCSGDGTEILDSAAPIAGSCSHGGSVTGCLVYESDTCGGDIALNSAGGGHFYLDANHLIINLAANSNNVEFNFEIVDTMGLVNGVRYTAPDQMIVTITDNTDADDPIRYNGCEGEMTIISYEAEEALHGNFELTAATTAGSCHVSQWYTTEGSFTSLAFCDAKDN